MFTLTNKIRFLTVCPSFIHSVSHSSNQSVTQSVSRSLQCQSECCTHGSVVTVSTRNTAVAVHSQHLAWHCDSVHISRRYYVCSPQSCNSSFTIDERLLTGATITADTKVMAARANSTRAIMRRSSRARNMTMTMSASVCAVAVLQPAPVRVQDSVRPGRAPDKGQK